MHAQEPADLGRDVRLLQEVSRRSGIHIVAATGHWLIPTPSFEARTADELADFFSLEIERGIEDTGIKPGVIKAASEGDVMTPFQENTFKAAARASKRTGVPVTTHSDESADFDYLAGLARRDYRLGIDHLFYGLKSVGGGADGIPTWQDRAAMIKKLFDCGWSDRILLATDWFFALTISPTGTFDALDKNNPAGNLFNIHNTIPYLRELGVTDEQIRAITVTNPKSFFARG